MAWGAAAIQGISQLVQSGSQLATTVAQNSNKPAAPQGTPAQAQQQTTNPQNAQAAQTPDDGALYFAAMGQRAQA